VSTLRYSYLKGIIEEACKKRYEIDKNDPQKDFIMIGEDWYQELIKHPFISSNHLPNIFNCIGIEKPGKAIYLMK
jgi:hypothetical protein